MKKVLLLVAVFVLGLNVSHKEPDWNIIKGQAQKAVVEAARPARMAQASTPETSQDIQKRIGNKYNVDPCHLWAIAQVETGNIPKNGDSGKSWGAYQIHRGYHPDITVEQAMDWTFSTEWTAKRLVAKGYEKDKYVWIPIGKHNGNPKNPKVILYMDKVEKQVKNCPIK